MVSQRRKMGIRIYFVLCMLLLGCVSSPFPPLSDSPIPKHSEPQGWWTVRFQIAPAETEEPPWHVDLILAHRVISPVLKAYGEDIFLWRFHRRALRDDIGHQFSFIFYAPSNTGERIVQDITTSPALTALKHAEVIVREVIQAPSKPSDQRIEATSDASWSPPVQRSWPPFIMGVSETWLQLIHEYADQIILKRPLSTVPDILAFYKIINDRMEATWRDEGGHAFLHHLNAVFGYEGVVVFEKKLMSF